MSSEFNWMTHGLNFYRRFLNGQGHDPSRQEKGDTTRTPFQTGKRGHRKNRDTTRDTTVSPSKDSCAERTLPTSKRILAILASRHPYTLRICEIHKQLIRAGVSAKYDTVKKTVQRLRKHDYIVEKPPNFFKIRDMDKVDFAMKQNRVPYKGIEPDSETPYSKCPDGDTTRTPFQTGKGGDTIASIYHAVRFRRVAVPKEKFIELRDKGRLTQPKNTSRSRQWKYDGECCDVYISEKSKVAWGVLRKEGWHNEILLDFGPETLSQVKANISCHVAIEDRDTDYTFRYNPTATELKVTTDEGSQFGVKEKEFEGPLEDVQTAYRFLANPVQTIDRIAILEQRVSRLSEATYKLSDIHREQYLDLKDTLLGMAQSPNQGGMNYHR